MARPDSEREAIRRKIQQDSRRQLGLDRASKPRGGVRIVSDEVNRADHFWERDAPRASLLEWIGAGVIWILGALLAFGLGFGAVFLWMVYR